MLSTVSHCHGKDTEYHNLVSSFVCGLLL
uniref:Uncharacterized protein n=1 Tax=Anguilla anguilla TaxID=7936 RepID=A0A0E9UAP3_ANGAN